jgi:insertion element IS1 protein InsB
MWHYVQNKKNKCWIWLAICKNTKLIAGYITGTRGYRLEVGLDLFQSKPRHDKTGRKLFEHITKFIPPNTIYYTDYWESYEKFIPPNQHYQGKDQTYTIEGYNSNFRDDLQRLTRRTKAYSKSQDMLDYSLSLYIYNHNNQQIAKLKGIYGV